MAARGVPPGAAIGSLIGSAPAANGCRHASTATIQLNPSGVPFCAARVERACRARAVIVSLRAKRIRAMTE
jgi:hypothetical protein